MELQGRTVVLHGDFHLVETAEAVRRLKALGARVTDSVTEETDLCFLALGERGPIPRTQAMLRTPELDEDALLGMLERQEDPAGTTTPARLAPPFLPPSAFTAGTDSAALRALLDDADWSVFPLDRDLPPLRTRLTALEREEGVTEAHRVATSRLRESSGTRLPHPYGHDAQIVGHALSPDGRHLATGSWVGDDIDTGGVLQIWEVATGRCVNVVPGITGGVGWPDYDGTLQWSADSTRLAVAYRTNLVGVWSPGQESPDPLATVDVSCGNSRPLGGAGEHGRTGALARSSRARVSPWRSVGPGPRVELTVFRSALQPATRTMSACGPF